MEVGWTVYFGKIVGTARNDFRNPGMFLGGIVIGRVSARGPGTPSSTTVPRNDAASTPQSASLHPADSLASPRAPHANAPDYFPADMCFPYHANRRLSWAACPRE